mgnify:CR=1 FL=1
MKATTTNIINIKDALTDRQIDNRIKKLIELDAQIKELETQKEDLKKEIISGMKSEKIDTGKYKVSYTSVKSNRFDSNRFKVEHLDLYKRYLKESISNRFTYRAV